VREALACADASEATPKCCLWCSQPLTPRRGGSPKRFCCAQHRLMFWHAARQWAERAIAAGILTVGDLKKAAPEACTLLLMGSGASDGSEETREPQCVLYAAISRALTVP
jgi:hypothetical protein